MDDWILNSIVKLRRAFEHIQALDDAIGEWRKQDPCPCDIVCERNEVAKRFEWRVVRAEPPPVHWGAIAGDVITNLNSALDIVFCQAIEAVTGTKSKASFPIYQNEDAFKVDLGGRLRSVPPVVAEAINHIKPYQGGNHLLWALRQLDNLNKHALLLSVAAGQAGITADLGILQLEIPTGFRVLKTGEVLFSVGLDAVVESRPTLFVSFANTGIADNMPMLIVLNNMHQATANALDVFQHLIPARPAGSPDS
jgi:hypothetical protein